MIGLLLAAIVMSDDPVAVPPPLGPRTAFMCSIDAELVAGSVGPTPLSPQKQLAFLLSGTPETASERAKVEVYDPDNLLGGKTFRRFLHADKAESYSLTTGPSGPGEKMLFLEFKPRDNKPVYVMALGDFPSGGKPRWLGFCLPLQSADTKADFDKFKAEGGFHK